MPASPKGLRFGEHLWPITHDNRSSCAMMVCTYIKRHRPNPAWKSRKTETHGERLNRSYTVQKNLLWFIDAPKNGSGIFFSGAPTQRTGGLRALSFLDAWTNIFSWKKLFETASSRRWASRGRVRGLKDQHSDELGQMLVYVGAVDFVECGSLCDWNELALSSLILPPQKIKGKRRCIMLATMEKVQPYLFGFVLANTKHSTKMK